MRKIQGTLPKIENKKTAESEKTQKKTFAVFKSPPPCKSFENILNSA